MFYGLPSSPYQPAPSWPDQFLNQLLSRFCSLSTRTHTCLYCAVYCSGTLGNTKTKQITTHIGHKCPSFNDVQCPLVQLESLHRSHWYIWQNPVKISCYNFGLVSAKFQSMNIAKTVCIDFLRCHICVYTFSICEVLCYVDHDWCQCRLFL